MVCVCVKYISMLMLNSFWYYQNNLIFSDVKLFGNLIFPDVKLTLIPEINPTWPQCIYPLHGPLATGYISPSWTTALSWWRGLWMKLWAMLCRATQDGWVIAESSDKTWSTGGGNGKPPQCTHMRTQWTVWEVKKTRHWKTSPPGLKVSSMLLGKSRGEFM